MSRLTAAGVAVATACAVVLALAAVGGSGWIGDLTSDTSTAREQAPARAGSNGVTDGDGSEVIRQPEGSATKGLPGLKKAKQESRAGRLTGPLPRTASTQGRLVAGFPASIVPVVTGSAVHSSGVSSSAKAVQVSLVASTGRSPREVLAAYRAKLSRIGFTESPAPAAGGSTAASHRRGHERLTVTVTKVSGTKTTYSVYGTLRPAAND
jgi:hypothetical protein